MNTPLINSPNPHKKLLLIDDDEVFCDALQRALTKRGFSVLIAHNSGSSLNLLDNNTHYAIVDMALGKESGLNLIPHLRQHYPGLYILVLTGYASIATTVKALKAGADNYLAKPADANAIMAALGLLQQHTETPPATVLSLKQMEWEHIQRTLLDFNGNVSATARKLGMHRRTLQRKLEKKPSLGDQAPFI